MMRNFCLHIGPTVRREEGIAAMGLFEKGSRLCELDIQFSLLRDLRHHDPVPLEFVLLASAVYALDRTVLRGATEDSWTRDISLSMPVRDPARWNAATGELTHTVSFLTGDRWTLNFTPLTGSLSVARQSARRRATSPMVPLSAIDTVCLLSGGLDSLVGAIDHLEHSESRMLLMGHHEAAMAGPFGDQRSLIGPLRAAYPQRLRPAFVRVGHSPAGKEITLRSRSLLFVALGMYAATAVGPVTPLLIPENGTIALNFPLTPSRRGSCSTRTAHPHYLEMLGRTLRQLGIGNPLVNPLADKTKGEVVAECANPTLLHALAPRAVSCAKRSRRGHWARKTARSCGQCMPCVYRRAAMHRAAADTETYGKDVCAGEVPVMGDDDAGRDFRACLSLLRRDPPAQEIASTLLASGPLDYRALHRYAALVQRAMDEIRALLRDKGTFEVRRAAGI